MGGLAGDDKPGASFAAFPSFDGLRFHQGAGAGGVRWRPEYSRYSERPNCPFPFPRPRVGAFKKANSSGLGSNIETQAVIEFVDPQFPLFELPPIYNIEVCYRLDKLATRMALLAVTARQRNTKLWAYELEPTGLGAVVPMPEPPAGDSAPPQVRPRKPMDKPEHGGK